MIRSSATSSKTARLIIAAIGRHERHDPFLSFASGVVTVLVSALEMRGEPVGKEQLLFAIEKQGANIPIDERLDADVAKAISEIQRHDRIHFQMMMASSVAALQLEWH